MALLVTAATYLAHLGDDDRAFAAETARINALPEGAIPNADLLGFAEVLEAYAAFSARTRLKAASANVLVAPVMNEEDDELIVFERQLREWQDHTAKLGQPAVSPIVPRDSPDHPSNEPGHGGLTLPSFGDTFSVSTGTKVALTVLGLGILVLAVRR